MMSTFWSLGKVLCPQVLSVLQQRIQVTLEEYQIGIKWSVFVFFYKKKWVQHCNTRDSQWTSVALFQRNLVLILDDPFNFLPSLNKIKFLSLGVPHRLTS